ncbi:P1 family peptidase [Amorphus orientalis]|uniref:L-aminopeptidase/D-esterase-like protein n=1 Tax=Amorphus orientalis TaxID=649198 RepID=A0AAE4ASV2_9HYPH|nr:P1 family peptidase [Amorphus orientalis]MDQ0315658.1 L-aminopeptidase/D-esterase-like protein [Amorphus orientalis]
MKPGPRNHLTDVAGLSVGHVEDAEAKTGVTAIVPDEPAVASVAVLGGAPGTRETDLLAPEQMIPAVDAIVLSGGSAFGLASADGALSALAEMGRGAEVAGFRVPIVPTAIVFDLANGGNKDWGPVPPFRALGEAAVRAAVRDDLRIGSVGIGCGCTTADLKGGLGSASTVLPSGHTVAAIVGVNAVGTANIAGGPHFWAAAFEQYGEFGGLGFPHPLPEDAGRLVTKLDALKAGANTTIALVATDAALTKAQAKRLAIAAHDGFARALWPAHTPYDGDTVFALSTGARPLADPVFEPIEIGAAAASTLARAIARGVYAATAAEGDVLPTWSERFGG